MEKLVTLAIIAVIITLGYILSKKFDFKKLFADKAVVTPIEDKKPTHENNNEKTKPIMTVDEKHYCMTVRGPGGAIAKEFIFGKGNITDKGSSIGKLCGDPAEDEGLDIGIPVPNPERSSLSRRHAFLFRDGDEFAIDDNSSYNGMYIIEDDGTEMRVDQAVVSNNMKLRMGEFIFSFMYIDMLSEDAEDADFKLYDQNKKRKIKK